MGALKHTPLFDAESAEGAKLAPVRGWSLPAYYPGGALGEYRHTRSGCSLFDLSPLGKYRVAGSGAAAALEPIIIIVMALIVIGIIAAVFSPMISLYTNIDAL